MVEKLISKRFCFNGIELTVEIPIPDFEKDPCSGIGLGNSYSEKSENMDKMLSEILFPQYTRAMKSALKAYESSRLPQKFLYGQRIKVTPFPMTVDNVRGYYDSLTDLICLDSDSFSLGFFSGSGNFLYGHETGHRIIALKKEYKEEALSDVSSILSISESSIITEFLCDAFGYLMADHEKTRFDVLPRELGDKRDGLALVALKLAWRC